MELDQQLKKDHIILLQNKTKTQQMMQLISPYCSQIGEYFYYFTLFAYIIGNTLLYAYSWESTTVTQVVFLQILYIGLILGSALRIYIKKSTYDVEYKNLLGQLASLMETLGLLSFTTHMYIQCNSNCILYLLCLLIQIIGSLVIAITLLKGYRKCNFNKQVNQI